MMSAPSTSHRQLRGRALVAAAALSLSASPATAQVPHVSVGAEIWGYASRLEVRRAGASGPGDARLNTPDATQTLDLRLDGSARFDAETEAVFKPRLITQHAVRFGGDDAQSTRTYLGQGYLKRRLGDAGTLVLGRELIAWGPSQLRSPSSPFYFDAGRTRPLVEPAGVDLVRAVHSTRSSSASVGYVRGGPELGSVMERTPYAKADYIGETFTASMNVAAPQGGAPFWGGYLTWTPDQAWVVYAEAGSFPGTATPGRLTGAPSSQRQAVASAGATYAFEHGTSVTLEGLYDGRGLDSSAARALLTDIERGAAPALAPTSSLLGSRYLYLMAQSDLQHTDRYWRVAVTRSLVDTGTQFLLYGETSLGPALSALASAVIDQGGARSEFDGVLRWQVTVGLKWISR